MTVPADPPATAADTGHRVPDPPTIAGSLKSAAGDFYFNSWRLVPANVIWGALLLIVLVLGGVWLPLLGLVFLLAVPAAGMYRLAALIQRGEPVAFTDGLAAMLRFAGPALLIGISATFAVVVFTADIAIGLSSGGIAGGVFAILGAYADLAIVMYLVVAWPIVVDPRREQTSLGGRLRLAFFVVAARPGRIFVLTLVIGAITLISTVLIVTLLTVSVAYVSLVATRYVLPAADRFEGRATLPIPTA